MKKLLLGAALAALLAPAVAHALPDQFTDIQRGRGLVAAGDCVACHTAPGGQPFAGGAVLDTPFGGISTPNLTPDDETGLGQWTEDMFFQAMHEGRGKDGMRLYPAFPYPFYTKVTRADSNAIFAYLKTLQPVRNKVDRNTLPFPFNIRLSMLGWNTLFFSPAPFQPDAQKSAEYNRGAYLVEGLGHCGACHTPLNALGANKDSQALQGGVLNDWLAPSLTADKRTGIGGWSVDDIVTYLTTGRNAHSQASGPMAEVITNSTSQMDPADVHAIAVYLNGRATSAVAAPTPLAASDSRMQAGEAVYVDNCSACHTRDGSGQKLLFPPLAGNAAVQQDDPTTLAHIVLTGIRGAGTDKAPTAPAMPSFSWRLSDQQVADVLTYIRNSWGNAAAAVSAGDVGKLRARVSAASAAP